MVHDSRCLNYYLFYLLYRNSATAHAKYIRVVDRKPYVSRLFTVDLDLSNSLYSQRLFTDNYK